ncbi:MAG: SagB/ThcOx family dehydrogenase [Tissierellia bacterium]|nr:SagB/ThcOx family dehydrogenase [Tissierellia bacterium]
MTYSVLKAYFNDKNTLRDQKAPGPGFEEESLKKGRALDLPDPKLVEDRDLSLKEALEKRRTIRNYGPQIMTLKDLSYILHYTYGNRVNRGEVIAKFVPSAGERYSLNLFVLVFGILDVEKGVYYYSPSEHRLYLVNQLGDLQGHFVEAMKGQEFAGRAKVALFLAASPERIEYAYPTDGNKLMLLDAGHVFQNAILAGLNLGFGSCPLAKYDQDKIEDLLALPEGMVAIYALTLGKVRGQS